MKALSLIVVAALGVLSGCNGGSDARASTTELVVPAPIDGSWLVIGGTIDGSAIEPVADRAMTMTIDGDRIGGHMACNGFDGTVAAGDETIQISNLSSEDIGCVPDVMAMEERAFDALRRIGTFEVIPGSLTLRGEGVTLELALVPPVPTDSIIDIEWVLAGLLDGEAETLVETLGTATLMLADDFSFSGTTTCERFAGEWNVFGAFIIFPTITPGDPLAGQDCTSERQPVDQWIYSVLRSGFVPVVTDGRMTLTSRDGTGLVYELEPPVD